MSKYSEKTKHQAPCARCDAPAEKLVLIGPKPYWLCTAHYQEHTNGMSA